VILLALVSSAVALPAPASADVLSDWNGAMITAQQVAATPAPPGTRLAAIVQASVFDAVNGIHPRYRFIHVRPAAPGYASREAAAAGAAHQALVALFPAQQPLFDAQLARSIAAIHRNARSISAGLAWGRTVADSILAWRATDGSGAVLPPYVAGTAPGDWQPTPPAFIATPLFRGVGVTTPFGLRSASQFPLPGPPPLTSRAYARAIDEVRSMGSLTSANRSPAQTLTAKFWASDSPVACWNRVAVQLLSRSHHHGHDSIVRKARILALINLSMADGAIAVWEAKARFDTWRPITAIQPVEPGWGSLLGTPAFQEYPSGHAGVSGAAVGVLARLFGDRTTFTVTSIGFPGLDRSYRRFSDAIDDIADARTFAGIHFRFASVDGSRMGERIGKYVTRTMLRPLRQDDD
jgi:membrane-associated phospholipid phosphatase